MTAPEEARLDVMRNKVSGVSSIIGNSDDRALKRCPGGVDGGLEAKMPLNLKAFRRSIRD